MARALSWIGVFAIASPTSAEEPPRGSFDAATGLNHLIVTGKVHPPNPTPDPSDPRPARFYPEKAQAELVEGAATLRCGLSASGAAPSSCTVLHETPAGYGFGDAALTVTHLFHGRFQSVDDGVTVVTVTFKFDGPGARQVSRFILRPNWVRVPTENTMDTVLKRLAPDIRTRAWAVVECDVSERGDLPSCTPLLEEPQGLGVGDAAATFAAAFVMKPVDLDGHPVAGGRLLMKLRFNPK